MESLIVSITSETAEDEQKVKPDWIVEICWVLSAICWLKSGVSFLLYDTALWKFYRNRAVHFNNTNKVAVLMIPDNFTNKFCLCQQKTQKFIYVKKGNAQYIILLNFYLSWWSFICKDYIPNFAASSFKIYRKEEIDTYYLSLPHKLLFIQDVLNTLAADSEKCIGSPYVPYVGSSVASTLEMDGTYISDHNGLDRPLCSSKQMESRVFKFVCSAMQDFFDLHVYGIHEVLYNTIKKLLSEEIPNEIIYIIQKYSQINETVKICMDEQSNDNVTILMNEQSNDNRAVFNL